MKKLFATLLVAMVLSSCALSPTKVGRTALVSNVSFTDSVVNIDNVNFSNGTKEGKACGKNILWLYATGDMSVESAKKNGRIMNITSVTSEVNNMILMSEICTVVRGN
ncbi:MAG: TRL domain-containing protein [Rickettsiales bacterium]|nr:TRL domain-containing protein [Rickettsiales bacterium]